MPGPRKMTEEQKARLEADVATRDELKVQPPLQVTYSPVTGTGYMTAPTVEALRPEDGEFYATHVQLVPKPEEARLYMVPSDKEGKGAEKLSDNTDGSATCFFRAGMNRFSLEEIKGHNMRFSVVVDTDSAYGYALILNIHSLEYIKIKRRTAKKKQAAPSDEAAGATQPKP